MYKKLTKLQIDAINSMFISKNIIRDCERRQADHDEWVRQRDFENNNVRIWE